MRVRIDADPVFGRQGNDLTVTLPVTFLEAALGATVDVPTLEGSPVSIRISPGSSPGRTLRVRGRGIPTPHGQGDLLVTLEVAVPEHLNDAAHQALRAYADATRDHDPRARLRRHTTAG